MTLRFLGRRTAGGTRPVDDLRIETLEILGEDTLRLDALQVGAVDRVELDERTLDLGAAETLAEANQVRRPRP